MRIGVAVPVVGVDIDRLHAVVGHVEGRERVLVLALHGVVELHHRG